MRSLRSKFDPRFRYTVEEAAELLRISRAHLFKKIKVGEIFPVRDASRVFIPGSEILRLSTVPT